MIAPAVVGRSVEVLIDLSPEVEDAETVERFEETPARAEEVRELPTADEKQRQGALSRPGSL
ncbi:MULTISPECIES: hypothetical protein [Streptomyces]|uniref:Uncharacterized protein n=1 Tax=Streptomyces canarius TaxID=285453 RepID=A0ABQ3CSG2_9ACTN|nr:hypothetical protein [Streptomyces canarius]GHA41226.1 hypothetical protein GCM10010345_52410 [Streptomyces canarius]